MKKFGLVASGGGYRSFYTAGVLVWLKRQGIPVVHVTSASSGNNIILDYLLWDWDMEELPPILTKTFRLNLKDIFEVFANFAGLQPPLLPNGSYLFTVDKNRCRKSLLLDRPERQKLLAEHLQTVRWDIMTTNLTRRRSESFRINDILATIDRSALDRFMDVFIAGITTIPYFRAIQMNGQYYLEGGYTDNTPLRSLFENPEVEQILAVDFTDYDYHTELEKIYGQHSLMLAPNSIEMNLVVSDIQLSLPNSAVLLQALFINQLLQSLNQTSLEVGGKIYYYKPLHILKPKNLESMTVSLQDMRAQKEYFQIGQQEIAQLWQSQPELSQV